ncbi:MAG: hypothetical protein J3K34DRAFT_437052 [Monoraphidium minutum]|nr:MAG: hypothetical protein J3K34DRAFT_437052 [Monoraphidium minutum]
MARVYTLVNRYVGVTKHTHLLNPRAVDSLLGVNLQAGGAQPVACGFWRGTVEQLGLTPAQVEDLCAVHELYTRYVTPVLAERAALQARVGRSGDLSTEMETSDALSANLKKELALRLLLHAFTFDRVFTPLQMAVGAVGSFPMFPDVYAMVTLTARGVEEQQAPGAPRQPLFPAPAPQGGG